MERSVMLFHRANDSMAYQFAPFMPIKEASDFKFCSFARNKIVTITPNTLFSIAGRFLLYIWDINILGDLSKSCYMYRYTEISNGKKISYTLKGNST